MVLHQQPWAVRLCSAFGSVLQSRTDPTAVAFCPVVLHGMGWQHRHNVRYSPYVFITSPGAAAGSVSLVLHLSQGLLKLIQRGFDFHSGGKMREINETWI